MTLDLGALRRQAENNLGDPVRWFFSEMTLHPSVVLELLDGCEARDQLSTALGAWSTAFGTTQLSHAVARLEAAEKQRDAILAEARCWAMEAKTQRGTVNEVGSALGGMADWGPIAAAVRAALTERDVLSVRVQAAERECAQRYAIAAQVAALREALSLHVHAFKHTDCNSVFAALANTAQAATEYRERIVREERDACAAICDERAVLNEAVEGAVDESTDPHTGVKATAADHRAFEARSCADEIRARESSP